ncbi:fasciclin domain-containing protein [Flavobacterium sp. SOK18b]|nr:fasciclin domain-containing protein [Flavobacterium sp. SOK18b]
MALLGVITTSCGEKKTAETAETADTTTVAVDSAAVVETPNIVGVAAGNADFSTLVTAVKAAGLVETLSSEGPFTVFAPNNAAFDKLPAGTVDGLLKPESLDKLKAVLTYHVVSGKFDAAAVTEAINKNNGKFTVTTVQGGKIELSLKDGKVILTDANGATSTVVLADVAASNGVIHAIDSVVMPK